MARERKEIALQANLHFQDLKKKELPTSNGGRSHGRVTAAGPQAIPFGSQDARAKFFAPSYRPVTGILALPTTDYRIVTSIAHKFPSNRYYQCTNWETKTLLTVDGHGCARRWRAQFDV